MAPPIENDAQWRTAGDRIQALLDASAAGGPAAHERAVQLVGEVTDLYGAALERMLRITVSADATLSERLAADDLVASLLLVHGLHPHDVHRRVEDALERVRPYLGSHGGDVALLEIVDGAGELTARLQFAGSCKSCPSSAVTLELTVEDAIRAAAPEVTSIEVVAPESGTTVIPPATLFSRVQQRAPAHAAWHAVPEFADLAPGEVGGFSVAGTTVLACRVDDEVFAYRDRCGVCHESLAGAALHRRMGSTAGDAVLRCPRCRAHFDVVHAGACVDAGAAPPAHLEPIPLLARDGVLSVAMPAEPTEAGVA
ncbi:NifU family protein [Mycolicibacterium celeriflavum]|uniref:NifU family protein n=1 Tax=Mycolicibacterium celeriflavum TaxID=1249101 RepID=UPI003CEEC1DA